MFSALRKIYRNTLFRLSLLGALLFVVSLFISLGYIYFATISSELRRVDKILLAEVNEFQTIYENEGLQSVGNVVLTRITSREGLYLLQALRGPSVGNLGQEFVDRGGNLIALAKNDEGGSVPQKRIKFTYFLPESNVPDMQARRARAIISVIHDAGGPVATIVAGRDVEATMRTADRVKNAIITSALIALTLGLVSSLFVSQRFTRRIESFNRLATDVRAGQLNRRAPRNYSEDELDLLAEHLNAMLDHIDQLMKAMRYAGDSIAHDLRSPLTRLRTRLESAANEMRDQKASEALYMAAEDASELLKTFDSVLRIARLEAGEQREILVDTDPKFILDDIAELYEPACEDAGLEFETYIEPNLKILADRGLLAQAVSNLVENAIKYTHKGGKVSLNLTKNDQGRVVISVKDNGPGIPEEERERVKERFVRLDKSRSAPGSGLGMALVDAIATLHQAEFRLDDGIRSEFGPGLSVNIIFPRRRHLKPAQDINEP